MEFFLTYLGILAFLGFIALSGSWFTCWLEAFADRLNSFKEKR